MHTWSRLLQINLALWGHLAWWLLVRVRLLRPAVPPALRFAQVLEGLGTTFIKLGQGLSLHRELLPDDYAHELERLQDHVKPFDGRVARLEVERSFGRSVDALFGEFETEPFAAGSIAQVHRATMPDGRPVIVKVRRPGIAQRVDEDLRILRWFIRSVLVVMPSVRALRPFELVDELARNLHKEIDFRQEAMNIERFVEVFRDWPQIYVPGVVDHLYSPWVVVQEVSPGERIDRPEFRQDGPRLAKLLVEAYLHMFFRVGVYHGDPHPGNLFVAPDGRICLHDFGLVGHLDPATRLNLVAFMLAFAQQDADWLLDAFLDLDMMSQQIDKEELRLGLAEIIQEFARKPLRDWSFGEAMIRVNQLDRGTNVRLPHHLLVLMRAIFLMESTVRRLDPEFNLLEGLFARAGSLLIEQGPAHPARTGVPPVDRMKFELMLLARSAPRGAGRLAHEMRIFLQRSQMPALHAANGAANDAASRRIAAAVVAAGLYAAGSWLLVQPEGSGALPVMAGVLLLVATCLTWVSVRRT
jgi:ubiquinone biosynthesis protein